MPGMELSLPRRALPNGSVRLIVRPESVLLLSAGTADALAGLVASATYMGSHAEYTLDTSAGTLFAIVREVGELRAIGETVAIRFVDHGVYAVGP
jgi:iron(III) transport system ATP-binding protein